MLPDDEDKEDVTEIVLFSDFSFNEAEDEAFRTVQGLDGCQRCVYGPEKTS